MGYDYQCSFNLDKCIKTLGLEERGRVQCSIDKAFLMGVSPYVPKDTGLLSNSANLHTTIGSGEIVWNAEDKARRLYYGDKYWNWSNGGVQAGGLRGPYWAERYCQDGGIQEIEKVAREAIGK